MSIQPDMEKWKRRFFACLVLATGVLFLTGAREVTHDLRQPALQQQTEAELRDWGLAVLTESPGGRRAPAAMDTTTARVLLEACSRPVPAAGDHALKKP